MAVSQWPSTPYYADRFWSKVNVGEKTDCWEWTASLSHGYGQFWIREVGRPVKAHRAAYEMLVGPIPDGLCIDHLCRNRACVNPSHMQPVTLRENLIRGNGFSGLNDRKTHCPAGHEYIESNTIIWRGQRSCRTCGNIRSRLRKAKKKAANQ